MKTKYSKDFMAPIVAKSLCWSDVARTIHGNSGGGSVKSYFKRVADFHELDYSHFMGKRMGMLYKARPEQILQLGTGFDRSTVRKAVLDNNLLQYVCQICGSLPEWKGKPLTLTLDHINGNRHDHRLDNLRFVCPNCDTQLQTYTGKNSKGIKKKPHTKKKVRLNSPNYVEGINKKWAH